MSEPGAVLDAQTQAMIAQLRRYESDQVGVILDRGHAAAHALVQSAFARARASVAGAVQRERARRDAAAAKAGARAETRARLDAQLRVGQLLAVGWSELPDVLTQRWLDPVKRRLWCQGAVVQACQRLLGDSFLIEYAPGPSTDELRDLGAACGERQVSLQSVPELQAGVRISTPGAELDASTASLLADRDRIHSLLLEAYQAADPGPEPADA